MVGDNVSITGDADVHYDEALTAIGILSHDYVVSEWLEDSNPYPLTP